MNRSTRRNRHRAICLRWLVISLTIFMISQCADPPMEDQSGGFTSDAKKYSYSLGYQFGGGLVKGLKAQSIDADPESYVWGVRDAFGEGAVRLTAIEIGEILNQFKSGEITMESDRDRISYSLGFAVGRDIKKGLRGKDLQVDPNSFSMGVRDVFGGSSTQMTTEDMREMLGSYREKRATLKLNANRKQEQAYLEFNASKEGMVTLPSGLQYRVVKEGSGISPSREDTVTVHYRGRLVDGKVFDSSIRRGVPASFPLNRVIRGWTEGLQLMKEGGKWEFHIPSDLAYGDRGKPPKILPGSTLIFHIELIKVIRAKGPA